MCFHIHSSYLEELTAKEDIACYKLLYPSLRSICEGYQYSLNTIFELNHDLRVDQDQDYGGTITKGYHSYTTIEATLASNLRHSMHEIFACIIPSGSKYYYNPDREEYVSNQIIIKPF